MPYAALILSAGLSQRMGVPKMLLQFNETKTFLDAVVERYSHFGCPQIMVVVNAKERLLVDRLEAEKTIRIVINRHTERGRFYSIQLGLKAMNSCKGTFVHNIDNPFVYEEVLNKLTGNLKGNDYAVPVFNGKGGHPILISKKIIKNLVNTHNISVNFKNFLHDFTRVDTPVNNQGVLTNINTPEQYIAHGFKGITV